MHRVSPSTSRWLGSALRVAERPHPRRPFELPLYLCPSLFSSASSSLSITAYPPATRSLHTSAPCLQQPSIPLRDTRLDIPADPDTTDSPNAGTNGVESLPVHKLPKQCHGCGALSQSSRPDQPGYYDLSRNAIRKYLGLEPQRPRRPSSHRDEERVYADALSRLNPEDLERQGVDMDALAMSMAPAESDHSAHISTKPQKKPLCDRCHTLLHNNTGQSIYHPDMDSIHDTLLESPYKYNHVYHVLDAADFPMSLLPKIHRLLDLMPLRTKNRRSRAGRFFHGQKTEMSFVITRSDLLAPTKPQVDKLLPYLQEVLRDALGRSGRDIRLGNIRCVSSKRSWWTKELKEDIWKRGGAGWMVGKANVGKSQLFEAVFPKGRMDSTPSKHQISVDMYSKSGAPSGQESRLAEEYQELDSEETSLLPSAPSETPYPDMPLVSSLPGTTASPIRVPFGNGRGELIDLPGLERTGLENYVRKEHRSSLVMRSRTVPEQQVIKPGQSLLLGGLIRITPREPSPIILAYDFTPIKPHLTGTQKAIEIQQQTSELNVENISEPGTGEKMKHAGSFELKWDVTRQRLGPLTRKDGVGFKPEGLPYAVLSTDILIEGVGWVEVTAQVRKKDLYAPRPSATGGEGEEKKEEEVAKQEGELQPPLSALERLEAFAQGGAKSDAKSDAKAKALARAAEKHNHGAVEGEPNWPVVEVYSPEGRFVGSRRPLNGWLLNKPRVTAAQERSRPRKSMKGAKKLEKQRRRESEGSA